ncbi:TPA: hypothetical protein ACN7S4_005344 [Klebsiella pneumoniae]
MDTGILHLTGRSCHDNKSQRADPFVCLTRIIADKTKLVEDLSGARSCAKPDMARAAGHLSIFGRNGVMPGQTAMLTLAVMETRNGYLPDAIGRNDL